MQRLRTLTVTKIKTEDYYITSAEKIFVDRLASIWHDPQILFSNRPNNEDIEQLAGLREKIDTDLVIASMPRLQNSESESVLYKPAASAEMIIADDNAFEPSKYSEASIEFSELAVSKSSIPSR